MLFSSRIIRIIVKIANEKPETTLELLHEFGMELRTILTEMPEKLAIAGQTIVMTGLTAEDFHPSVNRFPGLNDGRIEKFCTREELRLSKEMQFDFGGEILFRQNSLYNELVSIAEKSDCSMIFVTHIPEELPECFTKHLKLNDGKIVSLF